MEEKTYSVGEAAKYLGIDSDLISAAIKDETLKGERDKTKRGYPYMLHQADLDALKRTLFSPNGYAPVIKPEVKTQEIKLLPPEEKKPNDGVLLQDILTSTFSFLAEHQFAISIKSLEEVEVALRLWMVKTPETTLNIVASGSQITVLSSEYQRQLEANFASTSEQLRKAESTLSFLRQKKREVILKEYAHDLAVWLEPRHEGFLVWCESFPFSAMEKTEEEALAAFRRVLWGYTCWLRNHQEKLTPEMQFHFTRLKNLLVEDK